jgi:hypothetical protein
MLRAVGYLPPLTAQDLFPKRMRTCPPFRSRIAVPVNNYPKRVIWQRPEDGYQKETG